MEPEIETQPQRHICKGKTSILKGLTVVAQEMSITMIFEAVHRYARSTKTHCNGVKLKQ